MNDFINLPDSPGNSITEKDIPKGVFRITKSSKYLLQNCPELICVSVGAELFECKYKHREGRSDTLSIGKMAMSVLKIKPGNSIRITKQNLSLYTIEKI
jgi:hypothetical protein